MKQVRIKKKKWLRGGEEKEGIGLCIGRDPMVVNVIELASHYHNLLVGVIISVITQPFSISIFFAL